MYIGSSIMMIFIGVPWVGSRISSVRISYESKGVLDISKEDQAGEFLIGILHMYSLVA